MINTLLKKKVWTPEIKNRFLEALKDFSDDEKCRIIYDATKNIMTQGGTMNILNAESILVYATQHFFNVSDNQYKALVYYRLGELYEIYCLDYIKAYTNYKKYALNNKEFGGTHSLLLRIILLRDNFTYSEEMEKELKLSYGEADLGLRKDRIYENIGTLLVARNEGNEDEIPKLVKRIKAIIKADELFFVDLIFRKDTVTDNLKPPHPLLDYVNSL